MENLTLKGKELQVYQTIPLLYSVKGHPGLWLFRAQPKPNMAHFCNLLDFDKRITVAIKTVEQLSRLHIFSDVITNQKEIDAFEPGENKKPPHPEKTYLLKNKICEMLLFKLEHKELNKEELIMLMEVFFPKYDETSFLFHHMKKIWEWYGIIKKYCDSLPEPETEKAITANVESTEK